MRFPIVRPRLPDFFIWHSVEPSTNRGLAPRCCAAGRAARPAGNLAQQGTYLSMVRYRPVRQHIRDNLGAGHPVGFNPANDGVAIRLPQTHTSQGRSSDHALVEDVGRQDKRIIEPGTHDGYFEIPDHHTIRTMVRQ